jgi:PKD repeat protein
MRKTLLVTTILFWSASALFSQAWMNSFEDKENKASFYEIQDAFNSYWAKRSYEKGKGFKQFKRWEYFMIPRIDKNGYLNANALLPAWQEMQNMPSFKSETANWTHLGPDDTPVDINSTNWRRGSGRVNCVSFHPSDPNKIYVGAPSGGFWKTNDGGNTWITTTDSLPAIGVSDIAVHPLNPENIFIVTGDGDARDTYSIGILKSTDGGDTWSQVLVEHTIQEQIIFRRIKINPENPDVIIATSNVGIFRTNDGGDSWNIVTQGHFKDLEFKPENPNLVFASSYAYGGGAAIFRSVDSGLTWTKINQLSESDRIELAVTRANPNRIYAVASWAETSGYLGMYRSDDSGDTWDLIHGNETLNLLGWSTSGDDSGGQGWYDLACAADPNDADIVYVGGVNVWKSINAGQSWEISAHWYGGNGVYVHADHHCMDFHPITDELFSGNDGGLYKTDDGGQNWSDLSDGLQILQIYRIGLSETNSERFVVGTQDNGSMRYDNADWKSTLGGDGMECIIDYTDDDIMYAEYYYGAIHRSTDGGYNFTNIQPYEAGNGAWVTPYIIDPQNPEILYAGFKDVYKTNNRGNSWQVISNNLTNGEDLQSLAMSKTNSDVLYAATFNKVYKTTNAGGSWGTINTGLPSLTKTYLCVNPNNPDMLWVTLGGFEDGEKVYMSTDGGASWTNYSESIPNVPVNCIVYEEATNHALYIGTDIGVFYRNSSMSQWVPYSHGLPNVIVNELEIQYNTSKLRAATYGRGVWESDLFELVEAPVADFSWTITNPCEGIIHFASISSGVPESYSWSFGDDNFSDSYSPTHQYSNVGEFTVKLRVENALGADSITKIIQLNPSPPQLDFTSDISIACEPTEIQFLNLSEDALSFTWDFGDGIESQELNPTHNYETSGSFDVSLTAHTSLCPDTSILKTNFINFDEMNDAIVTLPENGYGQTQTCCDGTVFDSGGENGDYSNNTLSTLRIQPANADQIEFRFIDFDVEAGSADECDYDKITIYDGSVAYDGYALGIFCNSNTPSGTYISTQNTALVKQVTDQEVTGAGFELRWKCLSVDFTFEPDEENDKLLQFTDISDNYPISWAWDFGDNNTSTEQNPTHEYLSDGVYEVSLTVTNEQGSYTETKTIAVGDVGIEEEMASPIRIFPNPAKDEQVNIYILKENLNMTYYQLISQDAKILQQGKLKHSEHSFSIDMSGMASGVYTLKVQNGNDTYIKKITKL